MRWESQDLRPLVDHLAQALQEDENTKAVASKWSNCL